MTPIERYTTFIDLAAAAPPETVHRHDAAPDGFLNSDGGSSKTDIGSGGRACAMGG